MSVKNIVFVLGLVAALFYAGYYLGSTRTEAQLTARYEEGMRQAAENYIAQARQEADAAAKRLAQIERKRQATEKKARAIEAELAALPADPVRDWTDDELHKLRELHAARFGAGSGSVPGDVR